MYSTYMKGTTLFSNLGFSENEALVYQTLVSTGACSVAMLVECTGLFRPAVYRALRSLSALHCVSTTPKGRRTLYQAETPERLKELLFTRFVSAEEEVALLEKRFSRMPNSKKPSVRLLEGQGSVDHAILAIPQALKKGDTYYRYSARDVDGVHQMSPRLLEAYKNKRALKQLERYVITNKKNYEQKHEALDRAIKIVPPEFDLFQQNVSQFVYGDKVLLVDYNTDTALVIENPALAEFQKKIFQLLFRLLPEPPKKSGR